MKINYKNINQTFLNNVKKYVELKREVIDNTPIINVHYGVPIYIEYDFKKNKKYHDLLKKIKLSIFVYDEFFSEKCVAGTNIVASPFFNGYFKDRNNYFLAIYNNKIIFYTRGCGTKKMENFCKRRLFYEKRQEKTK